jgi:Polyketide cyclase / dehydrase and lipid transport
VPLFVATLVGAASAFFVAAGLPVAGAVGRSSGPSAGQEGLIQLDPVTLSADEQAQVLAGRVILREIPNPGLKGGTFEAVGLLPGTLDEALAAITDYSHYADFMPRVERVAVTEEGPAVFLVEQYLKLPLGAHRRYRLRYSARRAADGFRIDWIQVAWPEVPARQTVAQTSGHWQVSSFGEGRLLAVYHVYTDPGYVPLGMKGLALSLSKRDLPKIIERVRERLKPGPKGGPQISWP